ncbi:hypothetical protein BJ165DRAFT_1440543 [Panaeolus papilionaceus]|nr:hypothetical protein BJ165DRAFT_1440543 [Panaeolus papilionaceus]
MGAVQIARNIFLGICLLLSLSTLGLISHNMAMYIIKGSSSFVVQPFQVLGIVDSILMIFTLPVLMIGKNSVVADLVVMFIFWVLWLAETILVMKFRKPRFTRFRFIRCPTDLSVSPCYGTYIIQSLATTLFVLCLVYVIVLFIYGLVSQKRGNSIWTMSMRRLNKPKSEQPPPFFIPGQAPPQAAMQAPYYNPTMVYPVQDEKPAMSNAPAMNPHNAHVENVLVTPA